MRAAIGRSYTTTGGAIGLDGAEDPDGLLLSATESDPLGATDLGVIVCPPRDVDDPEEGEP